MLKNAVVLSVVCFALPPLLSAAPGSVYGRALQKARSVSAQAEQSRALPDENAGAARKKAPDAPARAEAFSRAVAAAGLKKYPPSGARGVSELLAKKIVTPSQLELAEGKSAVTEKELAIAWFGTEAGLAGNKKGFPLFVSKPARGAVVVGFPDGSVRRLANRPRGVTGVISILKAESPRKNDPLWESYRKTAREIDKASK